MCRVRQSAGSRHATARRTANRRPSGPSSRPCAPTSGQAHDRILPSARTAPGRDNSTGGSHVPRKALLVGAAIAALLGPMGADAHAQVFGARPVVNSFDAQQVTTTSAKLSAQVTYNEKAGSFWFTYCRVSDCAQSTVDTPRQDDNPEDDAGAIVPRTVQWRVDGLRPGTQYQVTVHAGNDTHYFDATERTFRFSTGSPNVTVTADAAATTGGATQVAAATATLTGFAVAGTTGGSGIGATSFFEWGEAGALSNPTAPQALPAAATPSPMTAGLSGLTPAHDYSYRLVVVRQGRRHPGAVRTFRTIWAPTCA